MPAVITLRPAKPDSGQDLARFAERFLRIAGAAGRLPTPVDDLLAAAKVASVCDPMAAKERFLASLPARAREGFLSAWQKLRGIADLREDVIYVPNATTPPRVLWAKAHELGHEVIPWHRLPIYHDDDLSLRPEAEEVFDAEANYFASEVIFQGQRFRQRALDYRPSLAAVFSLADQHGASRQATLRRYIEDHDEAIACVTYLPSRYSFDRRGNAVLRRPWLMTSPGFLRKYSEIRIPEELSSGHCWADARFCGDPASGTVRLPCDAGTVNFEWQAFWNGYSLFVLLRRRPVLGLIGKLLG